MAYVELPFSEDVRQYYFAPLWNEKVTPSDEQLQAVDDLIEALMEKNEPDPDDRLANSRHTLNPFYQYMYQCLTHRAINPGKLLPEMNKITKDIMKQPDKLAKNAEEPLKVISKVFKLEVVHKEKQKKTGETVFGQLKKRTRYVLFQVRCNIITIFKW